MYTCLYTYTHVLTYIHTHICTLPLLLYITPTPKLHIWFDNFHQLENVMLRM